MKKAILLILASLLLLFTGCEALGLTEEEDAIVLTAEEADMTAMVSILGIYLGVSGYEELMDTYSWDAAAMTAATPGLVVTDNGDGSYTYVATDVNIDGMVIMNGSFNVSGDPQTTGVNASYTNFELTNPDNSAEGGTINGNLVYVVSTDTLTIAFEVSGIVSADLTVAVVLNMNGDSGPSLVSATIEGVDYITEFNTALSSIN